MVKWDSDKLNDGPICATSGRSQPIDYISDADSRATLQNCDNASLVESSNPVILACKQNKVKTLNSLLGSCDKTPYHLSIRGATILPDDEDETHHNAFYYAVRSGSVELLDTLIHKWPGNYFVIYPWKLDKLLSRAYAELKLKHVHLSENIKIFVEEKLRALKVFSVDIEQDKYVETYLINIRERIDLVLQNITLLNKYYANGAPVDEKFLFITNFIAENVHVLKRRLKFTYNILPWEEIEFCMVSFISSHMKQKEVNLFCNAILNKSKILAYMEIFAKILDKAKANWKCSDIGTFHNLPNIKREKAVADIVNSCPQLTEMYGDYQQIRDNEYLRQIRGYVNFALSADSKLREGQFVITRSLRMIGECCKNTLESPKLSSTTSELLLQVLPNNTRNIIMSLSNSATDANSLSRRIEIENSTQGHFWTGFQSDINNINNVVTDILYNNKLRIIRRLLTKIINTESYDDIKEIAGILSNVELNSQVLTHIVTIMDHHELVKILKEFHSCITDKTFHENELFNEIESIIHFAYINQHLKSIRTDLVGETALLKVLSEWKKMNDNDTRVIKLLVNRVLKKMPKQIESHNLKKIAELASNIFRSSKARMQDDNIDQVNKLLNKILFIVEFETIDVNYNCKSTGNIDKFLIEDLSELAVNYTKNLTTLTIQAKLFEAAKKGNLENVKRYIQKGADINARSINAWTVLHFAALGPSLDVVEFVVEQQLCVDVKDANGQSPLHIAASHGNTKTVEFFIKEGNPHINVEDIARKTPLHLASTNGHDKVVELLVKNHANISAKDHLGLSPLHCAIRNNHVAIAKFLLEKDATVDTNETMSGLTPLYIAAESGSLELVNFFLAKGANVNARNHQGATPLTGAVGNGYLEVVNLLILKGANLNSTFIDGRTPLHIAIENGVENIANVLLKAGANANLSDGICNEAPLHYAARLGYENIVESLLMNQASTRLVTIEGLTALHLAAQHGHSKVIASLLKNGVKIFAKDNRKWTPLHYAAVNGNTSVAQLLIQNGKGVNKKNIYNETSLYIAAFYGHKEFVELLVKSNAHVGAQDLGGHTPLHAAAITGRKDTVALLIENKAEVDARSHTGKTPLHFAARKGHKDVTAYLIENKACVEATALSGCTHLHAAVAGRHKGFLIFSTEFVSASTTPLLMAIEAGYKEIVDILVANNANVNRKSNNLTPLVCAIKHNYKDIAEVLIANGAKVNANDGAALLQAVIAGNKDLVELLLKNNARVDIKMAKYYTPLHLAAKSGNKEIVSALLARGANPDARAFFGTTPLILAAFEGHEGVAEVLIANRANVNLADMQGAPLDIAVVRGHVNVVAALLNNGANIYCKSMKRTALELAVAHNHLQVVKLLLDHKSVDLNSKDNADFTILHIASEQGNLEVASYLVDERCCIDAVNDIGAKPIHMAAREGHEAIVKFFLSKGSSVNEPDAYNQTVIHYAAMAGQLSVVKYLVAQGADINVKNKNCRTPLHLAAQFGHKYVIEVLLQNGAIYNAVTSVNGGLQRPLDMATKQDVINLLGSLDGLFNAAKRNIWFDVEKHIRSGAIVDSKNVKNLTALHYATWKGHENVVKILLRHRANANVIDGKKFTPLHYAVTFSHLNIVKSLLSYGAIYNAISICGKSPSYFSLDPAIASLLKLVSDCFEKVKADDTSVINDLHNIKDTKILKSVMCARNIENNTLVAAAIRVPFSEFAKQVLEMTVL